MARVSAIMKRRDDIYSDIYKQIVEGVSRPDINRYIQEKYDVKERQARILIKKAYALQKTLDEKELAALRWVQLNRLEKIYNEAYKKKDLKNAIAAAEVINKLFNLYDNKVKLEVTGDMIRFNFDNFENTKPMEVTEVILGEEIKNNEIENEELSE